MADYFGTSINESPTIVLPASEDMKGARGIALVIKDGGLAKPKAGDVTIGLSLMTGEDEVTKGEDVTVQVKDIGKWIAGGTIAVGDLLTADAEGKAVKATTAGQFIMAQALTGTEKKGTLIKVQIIKAGYAKTA